MPASVSAPGGSGSKRDSQDPLGLGKVERHGHGERVADVRAGDHPVGDADIGDRPGHRPVGGHQLAGEEVVHGRDHGGRRDPPHGGLERGDAAAVRRVAERTADVVAQADRRHARGQRRGFAATRPAGRQVGVPRVPGEPAQRAVGVDAQAEVGQVGPPDRDGSRGPHALDDGGVGRGHGVGQRRHALGGGRALHVDVLLDREGHPVEHAQGLACRPALVGAPGRGERRLGQHDGDGVQGRVHRLDALEVGGHDLLRRHRSGGDEAGQVAGAAAPQLVGHLSHPSRRPAHVDPAHVDPAHVDPAILAWRRRSLLHHAVEVPMPDFYGDLHAPIEWKPDGDFRDITYETAEGIAKITINRPEVRNAFRPQTLFELADAFNRARDDADVGVIIFTGAGRRGLLRRRRPAHPRRRRLHGRRRRGREGHRPAERARPADPDPALPEAGGGHGGGLGHGRRPRAPRGLRPHHRRRQRQVRPDRPEGRQLRRRLRLGAAGPHRRPEEGPGDLVPLRRLRRAGGPRHGPGQHRGAAGRARAGPRWRGAARCSTTRRWRCGC